MYGVPFTVWFLEMTDRIDPFDYAHSRADGCADKINTRILLYPEKTDTEARAHTDETVLFLFWTFCRCAMARLRYRQSHAVMQKWLEPPLSFLHTSLQQYSKLYYPPTAPCQYPTASLLLQSGP